MKGKEYNAFKDKFRQCYHIDNSDQCIEKLAAMGVLSLPTLSAYVYRDRCHVLIVEGHTKTDAMWMVAEQFDVSYETVRGAIYNSEIVDEMSENIARAKAVRRSAKTVAKTYHKVVAVYPAAVYECVVFNSHTFSFEYFTMTAARFLKFCAKNRAMAERNNKSLVTIVCTGEGLDALTVQNFCRAKNIPTITHRCVGDLSLSNLRTYVTIKHSHQTSGYMESVNAVIANLKEMER